MILKSVLYVSRAVLPHIGADDQVSQIVAGARERNRSLQVTGALVFTGNHFAQILEGPADGVEAVVGSIQRDPRHHSLATFVEWHERRFYPDWSLAYSGPSTFVDRRIRPLFAAAEAGPESVARSQLTELMQELAIAASPAPCPPTARA